MEEYYIGLMSGTSCDSIDAVLVDLHKPQSFTTIACHEQSIDAALKQRITALIEPGDNEINRLGQLDRELGELFASAANELLKLSGISAQKIRAIGSHGQNIRHQPYGDLPFTLQIADPNTIAERTGITTVADFRRRNIAQGGVGAPLTPAFHHHAFADQQEIRIVLNIGGIANISVLAPKQQHLIGFDTGPGNTLLDNWIFKHKNERYDKNGHWASSGTVHDKLLQNLLNDPYFQQTAPKSTGREYFNLNWLHTYLTDSPEINANDIQATLAELTAVTIADAIKQYAHEARVIVCGGGAFNTDLLNRLQKHLSSCVITSSTLYGLEPQWLEAIAFAWFAQQTLQSHAIDLCSVTGANRPTLLGGIYPA